MPKQRFLIAPLNEGLQNNVSPWLLPENAYVELSNMYMWRSRLRKRFGSDLLRDETTEYDSSVGQLGSRMRVQIDTVSSGAASGTISVTAASGAIGQLFSVGSQIFTVYQASGDMYQTGTATTATFNTATLAYAFAGLPDADTTPVYWYPSYPIMGISLFETGTLGQKDTIVFDTSFAYEYSGGAWERLGTAEWTGGDDDFFYTANWVGSSTTVDALFVSNFNFGSDTSDSDSLKYYTSAGGWIDYTPQFTATATDLILTAKIIVAYKDRLLLLNVVENTGGGVGTNAQYGNRCRYSQNGDPVNASSSFVETPGGGGFIDAATNEQIIGAEFVKDRLIVFFENSTWELVYTGNEVEPFVWQKLDTSIGVESTFSVVPFDELTLGVGGVGIHACNGNSVRRVDGKIPDAVFNINNENNGQQRVHGIRDYYIEQVYWTYPNADENPSYPNKVLVFDYKTGTWSVNDDSITTFGYFYNKSQRTWESSSEEWQEADYTWSNATLNTHFRQTIAGNQQGCVFVCDAELSRNAPALSITNIAGSVLTIINHNLYVGDYVAIENSQGATFANKIYRIISVSGNDITIDGTASGTYTGGGTIARVSEPRIKTKDYNFFNQSGVNAAIDKIDVLVDRTQSGELSIDTFPSSSTIPIETLILETSPYDTTYYPLERTQNRLWHTIYPNVNGETYSFLVYLSDDQLRDEDIAWSWITIHAFLYYAERTSAYFY